LGKGKYFGLTFPLEDSTHIKELRALSNDPEVMNTIKSLKEKLESQSK